MRDFGWTRVAFLLFVLTALTIIVRLGDSGVEARSLAAGATDPREQRVSPAFKRWTEDALSSLEDARGEVGGPNAPKVVEPRAVPVPGDRTGTTGQRAMAATEASGEPSTSESLPPVFYRPSTVGDAAVTGAGAGPVCGDLGRFPKSSRIVFPLEREYFYSYEDTWGAARPQGGHEGTDLMTPAGVPEYAVTDGTVVPVSGSNANGWNTLGGYAVMVRADYSIGPIKRGDLFYYAHLERESPLPVGTRVRAGQVVGYSGDTGQGPEVTRGLFPPHLHFGWYDGTGGRSAVDSGAINPYPLLEWIQSHGGAVAGGSDARYCEALGPPPAAEPEWPDGRDPGVRPDLDTGTRDPSPSPVVRKEAEENPTNNPARPNRPDEPPKDRSPKKNPNDDQERSAETDRPATQKPAKPSPPDDEPTKPGRSASGQDPPPLDPQLPSDPKTPTENAYDPATGDPSNTPDRTTHRSPKDGRQPKTTPAPTNKPNE